MLIEIMAIHTIWINVYLIFVNYLLCGKVNFLKLNQAFRQIVFVSYFMIHDIYKLDWNCDWNYFIKTIEMLSILEQC